MRLPLFLFLFGCIAFLFLSCKSARTIQLSVVNQQPLYQADPTIFSYHHYYLYGTNGGNADSGFKVFESDNLQNWRSKKSNNGYALLVNNNVFGTKGFWAPQVVFYGNKFYMAYTANEHIAIAESNSPEGLFVQKQSLPIDTTIKQIDPFLFFDDDGKIYLYHVRLQNGNRIFVEELNADFSVKPNTLHPCISAADDAQPWENTQHVSWTVSEGPTVIKRNGLYYLFYSANDFTNPDYAVGYVTAKTPLGPWRKWDKNPIISRQLLGVSGTGHGDIVVDKNGNTFYVFHTQYSSEKVSPRKTAIVKLLFAADGSVSIDKNTFRYLKVTEKNSSTFLKRKT